MSVSFQIEAASVTVVPSQRSWVRVDLEGVTISELISAVGEDTLLDIIGAEAAKTYFDLVDKE